MRSSVPIVPNPTEPEGERRHLTVMFCDLVGSTSLSERLDPEDLRDILEAYRETSAGVIARFEGYVAQYLGDGLVVYFSFPQAHEDDAERAVRAGLAVVEELSRINPRLVRKHGVGIAVRVGIHTGPVVLGEVGGAQQQGPLAFGQTMNMAARLQAIAQPNSVVISGATLDLVRGRFDTADLGARRLKGIEAPVSVHRVLRPSGIRDRLDLAVAAGLTPLVGRDQDLAKLLERWDRARDGHGQVVLVRGEAGIGKSRLVLTLHDRLRAEHPLWFDCHGSPYHENSAFHPVIDLLRRGLRLGEDLVPEEQIARLELALDQAELERRETLPLLAGLLSLDLPANYRPLGLSAEALRRRLIETLASWLFALARQHPTVLVLEDLHWFDPSSLELLNLLVERAKTAPLLQLLTFRPSFHPPWDELVERDEIEVQPLTRRHAAEMVETIAGEKELPSVVVEQVALRTDGVPLFVEELTKSVLESRSSTATAVSIPTTLQDSLMARLDRLGPAKDVAQVAAVLGREFSHDLLAEVSTTGDALDGLLAQLVAAELVYERSASPNLSYIFKHALIQETAYESLLRGTRRALHARIARVLEERFPARAESHPEELARHAEGGGLVEKAIDGYERAGCRANERSASAEAIGHLTRGIGLVRTLPEGPERDARELLLQVALAAPLVTAWGWGSAEVERAYERARELSERVDALPQLFQVVRGMVTFYVARAQLKTARALGERLLRIAESSGDDASQLVANQQMAIILYYQGDSNAALEHYERALTLYDPARHRRLTHVYGEDLGVFIRIWMAWALCLRGFPDQAAARCEEAIALGREADHPFSYAYALLWAAVVHSMRREYRLARERAGAALAIAEEQDFAFVRGGSRLIRAWGRMDPEWERQARDAAIVEYGAALGETAATGSEVCGPQILGSLAEEYQRAGRVQEAAATLEAALATSERTGQPYWDAELLRLKGELVLEGADADPSAAERLFHGALDLSRSQSARWLELRAATSLARLWRGQGKRDPALRLLTSVYEWFEEGFDTCDLREAKALLAVLEQPA